MYKAREYDLFGVLDKCSECKGFVVWVFDRERHERDEPAFRVECGTCQQATDWVSKRCTAMTTWNKQQRQ